MYLSREEEMMWNGEFGDIIERAIKAVVRYGELMGADRLVKISHAHVSGISIFNIGDAGLSFIEDVAEGNARFRVYTTANPYAAVDTTFEGRAFNDVIVAKQRRIIESLRKLGATAFTCAPYYVRRPGLGEHLAWAESNAVLYANSVVGAMTNREGGPIALLEALIGRAPNYGMHLRDRRVPDYIVNVPKPSNYVEAAVIGYLIGRLNPTQTPLVRGVPKGIPEDWVRAMLAGFGASSHQPLMLIDGISPDLKHLKCLIPESLERVSLEERNIREFIKDHECSTADLLVAGCPHLSPNELPEIVARAVSVIRSGKVRARECWIITGDFVSDSMLKRVGALGDSRVKILKNVCPVVTRLNEIGVNSVCTDSAKALHYMPKLAGVNAYLLTSLR